ncbi:MAG: protein kinase [Acidimicrobiales bacterium]|nr:protein kinase [Acidimicrobiales bacterium]
MSIPAPAGLPADEDPCPSCGHEVGGSWLVCAWCGAQLAVAAELGVGSRVGDGRYQILRVIGRGGFGITYEVGDRRLQRRVAMKELFPESAVRHGSMVLTPPQGRTGFKVARERFMREARVLARFTHPGIVRVYEVFEEHGTAYLVMELLEGRTLVELLQQRGKPFPQDALLDVAGRVAAALRPVHAAGVLHRDVNPSNVMLTHHGRVVVIDFGLARDYDPDETKGMTRVVTPGYAPLEQYRGEGRFGPSTDVYGLAATCYRLATGRVPVSAVERDAGADLPAPHRLNPAISKAVSDAILDGLELEPAHRPQDLDSFLARLGISRLPEGPRSPLIDLVPPVVETRSGNDGNPNAAVPSSEERLAERSDVDAVPDAAPPRIATPEPSRPDVAPDTTPTSGPGLTRPDATASDFATPNLTRHDPTRSDGGAQDLTVQDLTVQDLTVQDRGVVTTVAGDRTVPAAPSVAPTPVPAPPQQQERPASRYRIVDGVPRPVGPHAPGRRKVLLPLVAIAVAAGSAAPVLATALLVLAVLPVLATAGDTVTQRMRGEHGTKGWTQGGVPAGLLLVPRLVRNVVLSIIRTAPIVVGGGAAIAGIYALDRLGAGSWVVDGTLRAVGAVACGTVAFGARNGGPHFRSGIGTEQLVERLAPGGRTNQTVVVLWIVAVFLVAGSLWLSPSAFPLP